MGNLTSLPYDFSVDNEINQKLRCEITTLESNIQKIDKYVHFNPKSDRIIDKLESIDTKINYIAEENIEHNIITQNIDNDLALDFNYSVDIQNIKNKNLNTKQLNFEPYSSYFKTSNNDIKSQWDDYDLYHYILINKHKSSKLYQKMN